MGEKYESPPLDPGDGAPLLCVCRLRGAGGGIGNLGGGARATPTSDCALSPVKDRCLTLELEDVRENELDCGGTGNCAGAVAGPYSSSSSSSCCKYGFSRPPAWSRVHVKSWGTASTLNEDRGTLSLRCVSRLAAHFLIISSLRNLMVKFSTPGSPRHQI
jgi:hypothetical protein